MYRYLRSLHSIGIHSIMKLGCVKSVSSALFLLFILFISCFTNETIARLTSLVTADAERMTPRTEFRGVGSAQERRQGKIMQQKQKARKQRIESHSQKFLGYLTRLNQEFKAKREMEAQQKESEISITTKRGGVLIQRSFNPTEVQPMKKEEGEHTVRCSFAAADCAMELVEHDLVQKFIKQNDSVLELGARFGTTSCAIAAQLGNSGKQVSVEPDSSVWYILEENQINHHCSFWQYRGVVTDQVVFVNPASYATRTSTSMNSSLFSSRSSSNRTATRRSHNARSAELPAVASMTDTMPRLIDNLSLEALQQQVGFRFTVLLIDCEGCINSLFQNDGIRLKDSLKVSLAFVGNRNSLVLFVHIFKIYCTSEDVIIPGIHYAYF